MVDYLEATLETLAQKLTSNYSVSERSNSHQSMVDVRGQMDKYRRKVRSQTYKAGASSGQRTEKIYFLGFRFDLLRIKPIHRSRITSV